MKCKVKETGEIIELCITDKTDINYVKDFIFNTSEDGFKYDDELELFLCSQKTIQWWLDVIAVHQFINDYYEAIIDNNFDYDDKTIIQNEVIDYMQADLDCYTIVGFKDFTGELLTKLGYKIKIFSDDSVLVEKIA